MRKWIGLTALVWALSVLAQADAQTISSGIPNFSTVNPRAAMNNNLNPVLRGGSPLGFPNLLQIFQQVLPIRLPNFFAPQPRAVLVYPEGIDPNNPPRFTSQLPTVRVQTSFGQ